MSSSDVSGAQLNTLLADLAAGLLAMRIELPVDNVQKNADYAALLQKWNRTYNLTAIRDLERIVPLHLLDSLAVLPHLGTGALLDVGSGAGLPGIPLAIARPALQVTLLDSNSKKSAFQQQAVIELGLTNVRVVNHRAEQFRPADGYLQIVSRAFSELADFVGCTAHLLAANGRWLAMKGVAPDQELSRLPAHVAVDAVHRLQVPGVGGERHLVVLKKV